MTFTPGLLFASIFLPFLALCYYCGVLPILHSRQYVIRKSDDPQQFMIGAAFYFGALILVALFWT